MLLLLSSQKKEKPNSHSAVGRPRARGRHSVVTNLMKNIKRKHIKEKYRNIQKTNETRVKRQEERELGLFDVLGSFISNSENVSDFSVHEQTDFIEL